MGAIPLSGQLPPGFVLDTPPSAPDGFVVDKTPPKMPAASDGVMRFGKGFVRGARDVVDQGAAMLARGVEAIAPYTRGDPKGREAAMQQASGWREGVDQINASALQDYEQNWLGGEKSTAANVGRVAGNIAAAYPVAATVPGAQASLVPRIASGAVAGGVTGALQPVADPAGDFWGQVGDNVKSGAIGGAVGTAAMAPVVKLLDRRRPEIQTLMDAGVRPTPGQIMGGAAKTFEDTLSSVPGVGDAITYARRAAVQDLNRGAINRALMPIGERLEAKGLGREAIEEMQTKVSKAYNDLLPKVSLPGPDARFAQDIQNIAQTTMIPTVRQRFSDFVNQSIAPRLSNGPLDGRTFKTIEEQLGRTASNLRGSADAEQRELGNLLRDMQGAFRELLARHNPGQAARLKSINTAFAMQARIEDAASRLGGDMGVFSPSQLQSAVRAGDKTARKGAFARGDAMMQDLSDPARAVLGANYPDSGTARRVAVTGGLAALTGGGSMVTPYALGPAIASGVASLPYLPGARNLSAHLLATRNPTTDAVRDTLGAIAAPGGAAWYTGLLGAR